MKRFKTEIELQNHFVHNEARPDHAKEEAVNVDTKLRREVMTSENGGKFLMNGRLAKMKFKSIGGGVWECSVT